MGATVYKFSSCVRLPEEVYWDSSFVVDLLMYLRDKATADYRHKESYEFYNRLVKEQASTISWISHLVVAEVIHVLLFFPIRKKINEFDKRNNTNYVRENEQGKCKSIKCFMRDHPTEYSDYWKIYYPNVEMFWKIIEMGFPMIMDPYCGEVQRINKITETALGLIKGYEISPCDAFHVSFALNNEVCNIVTNDTDFHRIKEINVYSCFDYTEVKL